MLNGDHTIKLFGAILTAAGCLFAASAWNRSRVSRLRTLDRLVQALTYMEAELAGKAAPLPQLALRLSRQTDGAVGRFFAALVREMDALGERPFCEIWTEAAEANLPELRNRERDAIRDLGASLGRYPVGMQCEAIAVCRELLLREINAARQNEREESRLVWGLSASAGLLLWILLI